jgi:hypothetical protein
MERALRPEAMRGLLSLEQGQGQQAEVEERKFKNQMRREDLAAPDAIAGGILLCFIVRADF